MAANIKATLQLDTKQAEKGVKGVGTALKALATGVIAKGIFDVANGFQEIQNKLKAVTNSSEETQQAFAAVANIAKSTRSDLSSTADLYFRLSKSAENLGLSQGETARVTELFAKTLKNSGATATEASSAILQFGQAMASGKLAGDEFRSLNETNSDLMDRLAKSMGKPRGELKKLASEGKITAEIIANALLESGDDIDSAFGKTTTTLAESLTMVKNEFMILVGSLETKFGVFSGIANGISFISENLKALGIILGVVFAAKAIAGIMNMVKAIRALQIVTKAQAVAQAVLLGLSGPAGWAALAAGAVATGVAIVALNKTFEETEEIIDDTKKSVDRQAGSTEDLVELSEEQVALAKKEKAEKDELARITKRQSEEFKSQLADLRTGSKEFSTQLDLRQKMFSTTEQERALLEEIADIESDRADEIRELNELTTISSEERLSREEDINHEYDDRIDKTRDILVLEEKIARERASFFGKTEYNQSIADMKNLYNLETELMKNKTKIQKVELRESTKIAMEMSQKLFAEAARMTALESEQANMLAGDKAKLSEEEMTRIRANAVARMTQIRADAEANQVELNKFIVWLTEADAKMNTFATGVSDFWGDFRANVTDNVAYGKRIFETMAQGWEDAIVKFAETGKLSFKDLFRSLMIEIIKMQANKMFLALFGAGGMFDMSSIFSGKKHQGGLIPAGKFGIAGEFGPEIINGPARVTSTAATANILSRGQDRTTQVTYNIVANDALSFKQMIARDPEYLYNVTQVGARRQPR